MEKLVLILQPHKIYHCSMRMIQHSEGIFVDTPPQKVLYCYGVWQDFFDDMEDFIPNKITFYEGVPPEKVVDEFAHSSEHGLIILDDLMAHVLRSPNMETLFTQGTHHKKLSCIFLSQNLYQQGKYSRTITLNTWYLVLFRNGRDASQIHLLARQLFPGNKMKLIKAYEDATSLPFGYLVIDLSPNVEDNFRLRTKIFPNEDPIIYT